MKARFFLALAALALAAQAQESNPYNGTWKAEYTNRNGATREGKVVISDRTGTWDMAVQRGNNPCAGRAYPIAVTVANATELSFEISRAKTLAGCKDGSASLKRVDDKTLEGEFDDFKLRLVRQ